MTFGEFDKESTYAIKIAEANDSLRILKLQFEIYKTINYRPTESNINQVESIIASINDLINEIRDSK